MPEPIKAAAPPFRIDLPASSANLGPGFDTFAIALDLYLKVEARPSPRFAVAAEGRDAALCRDPVNNLILETYKDVLQSEQRAVIPIALTISNQIPIGKGCGSSAAARLAGIVLAVHFGKLGWSGQKILEEGVRRETHADNIAACQLGGLVIARGNNGRSSSENTVHAMRVSSPTRWPLLLVVPPEALATTAAREVLPERYSRADAVANVQNAMLLVAALTQGRGDWLKIALADTFHEPYRAALCPLLCPLRDLTGSQGILGVALSGSGPSVLLVLDPDAPRSGTEETVRDCLRRHNIPAELIFTTVGEGINEAPAMRLDDEKGQKK